MGRVTNAQLVKCLEVHSPTKQDGVPEVGAIMLDGAAIVNMLKPGAAKTFLQYSLLPSHIFTLYPIPTSEGRTNRHHLGRIYSI